MQGATTGDVPLRRGRKCRILIWKTVMRGIVMPERKPASPTLILSYIVLFVLIVAIIVMGVRVSNRNAQVQYERSLTPTPIPGYAASVMQVTIDPSLPTPGPLLKTGSTGQAVVQLQSRLQELGYYDGGLDGQFGPATESAVRLFQLQHSLDIDGKVGPATSTVLYSSLAQKYVVTPTPIPTPTNTPAPVPTRQPGVMANGMPMLVNRDNYLPDSYEPVELVRMRTYCDSSIVIIKGSEIEGERIAVDALMTMLRAAHRDGLTVWQISAGYRSIEYQQKLFDNQVYAYRQDGMTGSEARAKTRQTVADPGASEHHLGLAFDVTVPGEQFSNTKQHIWLAQHCWEYGFILRYPLEKEDITGISYEPWHIRYVGVEHSLPMRDQGLVLEEYIARYGH